MSGEYSILTEALAQIQSHEFRIGTAAQHGISSLGWEVAYNIVHDLRGEVVERDRRRIQAESDTVTVALTDEEVAIITRALGHTLRKDRMDGERNMEYLFKDYRVLERFEGLSES